MTTPNINKILATPAHKAYSIYGANMGRRNQTAGKPEKLLLQWVRPVDGDYDRGGAYWGFGGKSGANLWCAFSHPEKSENDQPIMVFVRAKNREDAKAEVLKLLTGAGWSFYK
jgi:hypothetical protein